jgi:hypothetical protein
MHRGAQGTLGALSARPLASNPSPGGSSGDVEGARLPGEPRLQHALRLLGLAADLAHQQATQPLSERTPLPSLLGAGKQESTSSMNETDWLTDWLTI